MYRFISTKMKISLLILCFFFLVLLLFINKPLFRNNPLAGPFPYKFNYEKTLGGTNFLFDLDNDGKEECIDFSLDEREENQSHVHVRNSDFMLIGYETFNGKIKRIFSLDWNDNDIKEILVPYYRNDSLFLRILDNNANVL